MDENHQPVNWPAGTRLKHLPFIKEDVDFMNYVLSIADLHDWTIERNNDFDDVVALIFIE